jgi:tetratricopeptide (TPR) repeat protein
MNTHTDAIQELEQKLIAQVSLAKGNEEQLKNLMGDDDRMIAEAYYRLAKIYYDKADFATAKVYFEKAIGMCVYPRDTFALFKGYGFLIRIYSESLEAEKATKYIDLAEELIEKYGRDAGTLTAEFFYNNATVFTYKGDFEQALNNFQLAHQKAQKENEPELIAKSLFATATALSKLERYEEALLTLDQLKELLMILKKGFLKGSMYHLYANIYRDTNRLNEALESYELAIKALQNKNCWNLFGYNLLGIGMTYKKMGEFNKALMYFNLALNSVGTYSFKRLTDTIKDQVTDVNDSNVDLYLDRHNRVIHERSLGTIDFKHRFVLLEILFLLAKNPGIPYNKEDLAKSIWKDEYNPLIHDKLIYTSISRLRKLIEPKGGKRKYILRGKDGYTFNPRVHARFYREDGNRSAKIIGNVEINSPV